MFNTIYTIGYTGFKIEEFINLLKQHKIGLLIDVRSTPYSQFYSNYNKEPLSKTLNLQQILYRNYVEEFGARQTNPIYYPNGYLDFELFSKSEKFLEGLNKIKIALDKGYNIALMCSEKNPLDCHRTHLVSKALYERGYNIVHLMPNNETCTQLDIENKLLDKYFPDRIQQSLFGDELSDEKMLQNAYALHNKEIGYHIKEE